MAVGNAYSNQIQNRNFLAPVGFKFVLNRSPKVAFFSNSSTIPGVSLGVANQATPLKDLPTPGDILEFNDFRLRFMVDENLENYLEIQKWMRALGYPDSLAEIYNFQQDYDFKDSDLMNVYSDATLFVMNSNQSANFKVMFKDMFPYDLSDLQFDATDSDIDYLTAEVSFKYTIYNITDLSGKNL